ncbi:transcription antitermination factor NusB [Plantibacter sp. VKM Ac-2885]|uniref:Transcription antitermination protein NusB n=3 Tax=Plantibacter TaxID=190323 RepID=A0A1S7B9H5_9MICO|nr:MULTISPECIES: transcription antitermination factor NusB [Plantibacter]MBD8102989.1 transcription antitermination factor NusB [Plantibacter sp. CFBP 8775]MBD8466291.1 transcription antitermination factor NusB [Plantibacter sp. CFBP 8798]MBD8515541.1 transcription antitermination factor NusB [Plantibacter sp. CFBP 8804]MBF4513043.1 transcription antitermination factor NusB [Plantibacter sp. VKM Ac-2885]MBF4564952.1 transcription antitermination factor NusB [Plantibacter sp. VKM Ac-2876]NUJ86
MSARTKARKRALDLLYQADVRQQTLAEVLSAEASRAVSEPDRQASWLYAREIVDGVGDHAEEIDEQIETYAQGWTLARMPTVDRAILRIAIWEILFNDEVPHGVAIDEAVEAAKTLSTDDSAGFINGLLGKISQINPR